MLNLRNPHSVLAALETRPKDVSQIQVPAGMLAALERNPVDDAWARVVQLARQKKVPVTSGSKPQPKSGRNDEGGRSGGAEALVAERSPVPVEQLFSGARERRGGKGLWLALDCLQDPQNLGAIFRAAAFFGVEGVFMTQERSAPLTGTVYDVASGGVEYVPFAIQANLQRAFELAKDAGLWILGTSEHATDDIAKVERDRPWLLVLGNEEKGMRRLTEESCDVLCRVTPSGKVTSLNVSVAAGIFISRLSGA